MKSTFSSLKIFVFIFSIAIFAARVPAWIQEREPLADVEAERKTLQSDEENSGPADTVRIGAYVISVYNLDFPGNRVNVDFYIWYNTLKDSLNLIDNFEIINAIEANKSHETNEKRGDEYYQNFRVNSVIKKNWDISNFPFDRQNIEIEIEDYDKDITKLAFIPDSASSKVDKDVTIGGWKITGYTIRTEDHVYETSYGDPQIAQGDYSSYSRVILNIAIERDGNGLFFKLFLGLFISVLISLLTFFIDPTDLDPRFGLSVGAIFAAIASQYVITSALPQNDSITLVDVLHDISFIFIFICIAGSVVALHLKKQGKIALHKKMDRWAFAVLGLSYISLVTYFVLKSI